MTTDQNIEGFHAPKGSFDSIVKTTESEWVDAQKYEEQTWVVNNRRNSWPKIGMKLLRALKTPKLLWQIFKFRDFYCGDDWNFWWMEQFDNYASLPPHISNALEIGCGPYSNIRLISKLKKIDHIVCTDPLMDIYKTFKLTWVTSMAAKGKINAETGTCEDIKYPDNHFDLVVCNNVLDHVLDAETGLLEMYRVLKPGGYFVFAQDLTDGEGFEKMSKREGHPIRIEHTYLDRLLQDKYISILKKQLPKDASRSDDFYGTYILIGKKVTV